MSKNATTSTTRYIFNLLKELSDGNHKINAINESIPTTKPDPKTKITETYEIWIRTLLRDKET